MNAARPNGRTAALMIAVIITVTAIIATIDQWRGAPQPLRAAAATAWILYVVLGCTDRIIDSVQALRGLVESYGDERHAQGVLEGITNATPPTPPTQLRRH